MALYDRLLDISPDITSSVFLFGPRGTGKTFWLKQHFKDALFIDLLDTGTYNDPLANPSRLSLRIPPILKIGLLLMRYKKYRRY